MRKCIQWCISESENYLLNVKGLNDHDKRLRVWNMIKIWGLTLFSSRNKNGNDNKEGDMELVGLSTFALALFGLYWCFGGCFGDMR